MAEHQYGVFLNEVRVGTIVYRNDYSIFRLDEEYLRLVDRPVLGLHFEEDVTAVHSSSLRLPRWFSNLLPEGQLRTWVALDRGVSPDREMQLLAQVGHDLPGAVRVLPDSDRKNLALYREFDDLRALPDDITGETTSWRFSLAGVGLKFSMLRDGEKLTLPAHGAGGDWIVKLPDPVFDDVPRNEHAMMTLASRVGIETPEHVLVAVSNLSALPANSILSDEQWAYAVRRFDRVNESSTRIHVEDFAQVKNVYSIDKYEGSYSHVVGYSYRGRDTRSALQAIRRVAYNFFIGNTDDHLKNWSLIYRDPRRPQISPAYDLVSTVYYGLRDQRDVELGLKLGQAGKTPGRVRLSDFVAVSKSGRFESPLVKDTVLEVANLVESEWPSVADILSGNPHLQDSIANTIESRVRQIRWSS